MDDNGNIRAASSALGGQNTRRNQENPDQT
jgi:hypothetical protein